MAVLPALDCSPVASPPPPDLTLSPLQGDPRPVEDWVTTFHLVFVAVDPFTLESAWLLEGAARVLRNFLGADCRVAWLVTGDADQARQFLGPLADEFLTFVDPARTAVRALGLQELPAFVHLNQALQVEGAAEGWRPDEWRDAAEHLAEMMRWSRPVVPAVGDPAPYPGSPVAG